MASIAEGLSIIKHANAGKGNQEADAETTPLRDPEAYQYDIDVGEVAELWRRGSVVGLVAGRPHRRRLRPFARTRRLRGPGLGLGRGTLDRARRHRRGRAGPGHHGLALRALRVAWPRRVHRQDPLGHAQRVRRSRREEVLEPGRRGAPRARDPGRPRRPSPAPVPAFVAERAPAGGRAFAARFHFAVSGGHTPWAMFAELASETVPWEGVVIYQVDERVAPAGRPRPQPAPPARGARSGPGPSRAHAGRRRRTSRRPRRRTAPAARALRPRPPRASAPTGTPRRWCPVTRSFASTDRLVASPSPTRARVRMTLTYPALARARQLLWLVTGRRQEGAAGQAPGRRHHHPGGPGRGRGVAGDGRPMRQARSQSAEPIRAAVVAPALGHTRPIPRGRGPSPLDRPPSEGRSVRPSRRVRPGSSSPSRAGTTRARPRPAWRRATPRAPPDRRPAPGSPRSHPRRGWGDVTQRHLPECVAWWRAARTRSSSSGTGGWMRATGLDESAMTTKRSAAAATIFSRVCAAPAAFHQPAVRGDLVRAVDGHVESIDAIERLDSATRDHVPLRRSAARWRRSACRSDRRASAGSRNATVVPVPSPSVMPSSTSSAAASAASLFSWSALMAQPTHQEPNAMPEGRSPTDRLSRADGRMITRPRTSTPRLHRHGGRGYNNAQKAQRGGRHGRNVCVWVPGTGTLIGASATRPGRPGP